MRFLRTALDWNGTSSRGPFALVCACSIAIGLVLTSAPSLGWIEALAALALALCTPVFFAQARRRLRDLRWSGYWMWTLPVPLVSLPLIVALVGWPGHGPDQRGTSPNWAPILVLVLSVIYASRMLWHPYVIPAGSMKPTLLPDDTILATRLFGMPRRGDVVIFRHPTTGQDFVKRVIGLPGDQVAMDQGHVILNGEAITRSAATTWTEPMQASSLGPLPRCINTTPLGGSCDKILHYDTLPGGRKFGVLDIAPMPLDALPELVVPKGHVFVLGDNRDNSVDSRIEVAKGGIGPVPLALLVGRARLVVYRARDGIVLEHVR